MQQDLLAQMACLLHDGGINYSVFLRAYSIAGCPGLQLEEMARRLIGADASLEHIRDVPFAELEARLRACLGYAGDAGAGPEHGITLSAEFLALLEAICRDAKAESARSTALKYFRFRKGHPAYPVFWEFACAFIRDDGCCLLVGSGSD